MHIRRVASAEEAAECARIMSSSEPWLTLGRTYDKAFNLVNDPARETYVAVDENGVQGFVIISLQGAFTGYIQTVAVSPNARGQGIGTRLIHFAEQRMFEVSPNVFMCVTDFNTDAQRLYERLGYERIGELKDYIVRGHSEFLLRKTNGPLSEFQPKQ